jgi:hypothetical protein
MSHQPRLKLLALLVGVALALWGAGPARADSAVGVDTALGSAFNPSGRSAVPRAWLEDGSDTVRHSPSGQLYGLPYYYGEKPARSASGWDYRGSVELGVFGGSTADRQNTLFRQYKDPRNGLFINYFEFEAEKPDSANYFLASGGSAGQDDQFYGLQFGRYNDWKVKTFFNQTPHVFSSNFKPIFSNNGTGRPTLDNGTPGGAGATTAAALLAYSRTLPDTEVGLVRSKGGIRLDLTLSDHWKTYASLTRENRRGERPFGFQDGNVEGIEPIDYATTDLLAGIGYADKLTSFNLRASASFFKNDIDYLFNRKALVAAVANPTNIAAIDYGQYTLPPDNEAYNVKGEFSRKLPGFFNARLSAAVAWGSSRQDDPIRTPVQPGLALPTQNGTVQQGVTFNVANWNGVNGSPTSRATSGQRTDTTLLNLALSMNPIDDLSLKATIRHYETDNKSGTYYAYNPLTGQWGYGVQEGAQNTNAPLAASGTGCQPAPGFTIPAGSTCVGTAFAFGNARSFSAPPRDNKQTNYTLAADYELGKSSSLEASLEREDFRHTYRERDKTWEDKLKLGYVDRSLGNATLRASYEVDRKRGSFYDPLVTTRGLQDWFAFYGIPYSRQALQDLITHSGAAVSGIYPTLASLQTTVDGNTFNSGGWMKPDQADRDQNILNLRVNFMPREDLDVGAMVQLKQARYPGNAIGPQKDDVNSYNLDLNYQLAAGTQISAYYSRQDGRQGQVENYGTSLAAAAPLTAAQVLQAFETAHCGATLTTANIDCYLLYARNPTDNVQVLTKSTTDAFGFSVMHDFRPVMVGANYSYSRALTAIGRSYGPTALSAANQTVENTYGAWPDMRTIQQSLEFNVLVPVSKQASVRLTYRYSDATVNDWHYDYYPITPAATFIPADYNSLNGAQTYRDHIFGVFLQVKL